MRQITHLWLGLDSRSTPDLATLEAPFFLTDSGGEDIPWDDSQGGQLPWQGGSAAQDLTKPCAVLNWDTKKVRQILAGRNIEHFLFFS